MVVKVMTCIFFFADIESPVLLLVFSAGPVNITAADADPRVTAIMQCFFPAQATGEALLNVITMATADASPAGRLPYTWYKTADQVKFFWHLAPRVFLKLIYFLLVLKQNFMSLLK